MFCSECGKPFDEGVAFCPGCGAKVEDAQTVSTVSISNPKGEKTMEQKNGFFASLFDFSFTTFITTKIIKLLFGIGVVVSILLPGAAILFPVLKGGASNDAKIWALTFQLHKFCKIITHKTSQNSLLIG